MYTTTIGKTFLKAYNEKFGKEYTAKTFFEEIFIPLFFDHPKYMMTGGNSPLENTPKLSWGDMIKGRKPFETPEQRKGRIYKMICKIETEKANMSIAVGYGIADCLAATSGQITNIDLPDCKEDIYFSWIGAALGIGVSGGITILFNHEQLLLDIYEGWRYYRQYLEKTPLMKGNQIYAWNGQWIAHRYHDMHYDASDPSFGITYTNTPIGLFGFPTITWVTVLLRITVCFPSNLFLGYLYANGYTEGNTTIGFIPFKLAEISRPDHFYKKLFGISEYQRNHQRMEQLYGTAMGLRVACRSGAIGIQAMEPKGLQVFLPRGQKTKKIVYKEDGEQIITFNIYLIWILAMLNNEKLWNFSRQFAELLLNYEAGAGKAKRDRINRVNQLLGSTTSKQFLLNLIPIVEEEMEVTAYEEMGKMVHDMPKDNFPYFNTLIRFQYALLNK